MAGYFAPTTFVTLAEPSSTTVDTHGDEVDGFTKRHTRVPAHIAERRVRMANPQDGNKLVTARIVECLIDSKYATVTRGWRVTDERSKTDYLVDHTTTPRSPAMGSNLKHLELTNLT